jgi:outer membrane protein TolC
MTRWTSGALLVLAAVAIAPASASAQSAAAALPDVFLHGVPAGQRQASPLTLSLSGAVARGLEHNLVVLAQEQRVSFAEGGRWKALSETLPRVSGHVTEIREEISPAAFGFTGLPGLDLPPVIGPFNVFDARVSVSAPVLDRSALADVRKETALLRAEEHTLKNARELVILAVANLYVQTLADASRLDNSRADVATAEALFTLATDQRAAGVAAGIDVLRQHVQLESARQKLIAVENELAKQKLRLARAIGLPAGQAFELTDALVFTPAPHMDEDAALAEAYAQREDVKSAEARVAAAAAGRASAGSLGLPTVHLDGDYGAIGPSASSAHSTFTLAANLRVPIFQGGNVRGKVLQADADRRQRQAELDDLKAGVYYDVQAALLDLHAAESAVDVATQGRALAVEQLAQARDRFSAGVTSTIEVVQAQDALAAASDRYISALYAHLVAKAELARALGVDERGFAVFLGGRQE